MTHYKVFRTLLNSSLLTSPVPSGSTNKSIDLMSSAVQSAVDHLLNGQLPACTLGTRIEGVRQGGNIKCHFRIQTSSFPGWTFVVKIKKKPKNTQNNEDVNWGGWSVSLVLVSAFHAMLLCCSREVNDFGGGVTDTVKLFFAGNSLVKKQRKQDSRMR